VLGSEVRVLGGEYNVLGNAVEMLCCLVFYWSVGEARRSFQFRADFSVPSCDDITSSAESFVSNQ
jgi:hypothetical protein